MFKDKFLIFIILMIALLSIGAASASESSINSTDDSSIEVITSTYDESMFLDVASEDNSIGSGEDTTSSNKSFTKLNNTINSASDIKLDSNYKMAEEEANNFTNGITISKNITIDGNGFTIDANNLGRIFNITNGCTVTLTNLTLANGNSTDNGGAIHNNGTLTLKNIVFINNTAFGGGAIVNAGDNLIMQSCAFINNTAFAGGAIVNTGDNLTIQYCVFINNTATGEEGNTGAIANIGYGFILMDSTFINNSGESAGAIGNWGANAIVNNSTFISNTASKSAGAIYNGGSGFIVNHSSFINNTANRNAAICNYGANFIVNCSSFVNNSAVKYGGAICNWGADSIVDNSTFINNTANEGAAIDNANVTLTVKDSSFINNSGEFGVVCNNYAGTLNLNNNTYSGISEGKTYIYLSNSTLSSVVVTVLGNETIKTHPDENITLYATITCDGASVAGGVLNFTIDGVNYTADSQNNGIYNCSYSITYFNEPKVVSASYNANKTSVKKATLVCAIETFTDLQKAIDTASEISLNSNVKMTDGETNNFKNGITISKNISINGNGFIIDANNLGRIFNITSGYTVALTNVTLANGNHTDRGGAIHNNGTLTLNNVIFINNTAFGSGAIHNYGDNLTMQSCVFINNTALVFACGAISNSGDNLTVRYCVFINNTATGEKGEAGAVANTGNNFIVLNSIFINNTANTGGAISNVNITFTVKDSTFINNTANVGGAIANWDADFIVENSSFINNVASSDCGAIYNEGSGFIVNASSFINNSAANHGGAMINWGADSIVLNSTFINNSAKYGGAITNCGFDCIVENSTFINNTANDGGAIYNYGDKFIVNASSFINNTASSHAGAIANDSGDKFIVNASSFINNTASRNGGAIYNEGGGFIVNASTFINNSAKHAGAIYNYGDKFIVNASSFVNNSAVGYGGAMINWGDESIVDNSTFINNTANVGGAIDNNANSTFTVKDSRFINNYGEFGVINNDKIGTLNLNNNTYSGINEGKTYIYLNNGTLSSVVVTVLGNETIKTKLGENITLYATITCDGASVAGGVLNFTIDGVNYTADSQNNGIYNCTYNVAFDNCNVVSASFANATNSTIQTGILNARYDANLTVDNVVMIYHDGTRLIANLLDAKGNSIANTTISFTINGVTYNRTTDDNGSVSIAINLDYGLYNAVVSYGGNETYNPASVNVTVEVKSSVIGQNLVKMYQNNTQFFATFIDSNGKVLANTNVTFNINGVFYTKTTDVNGTAKLNINLRPGNYTLTGINPETGEQQGFNILVKSLIEASDLTKYYKNESKFQAKIYNKNGSVAINKTVTLNINGVLYNRESDENGTVKLAINLIPGNYTITTTYDELSVGNKVEVLPTLLTNDLTMTYKDGSKFNATVLDGQGNVVANKNVTFNVNGVFYTRTTDDKGVASLAINLMSGEYIITSIYNGYQTGNKITIQ